MLYIDWLQSGTLERDFHRTGRTSTVLWTGSHMVCISACAVSHQFGYGRGTPSQGMFQFLYDDQTRPFGHYETIAPGVPWTETLLDPANPGAPHLALALKSGNFGGEDFFMQALGLLANAN